MVIEFEMVPFCGEERAAPAGRIPPVVYYGVTIYDLLVRVKETIGDEQEDVIPWPGYRRVNMYQSLATFDLKEGDKILFGWPYRWDWLVTATNPALSFAVGPGEAFVDASQFDYDFFEDLRYQMEAEEDEDEGEAHETIQLGTTIYRIEIMGVIQDRHGGMCIYFDHKNVERRWTMNIEGIYLNLLAASDNRLPPYSGTLHVPLKNGTTQQFDCSEMRIWPKTLLFEMDLQTSEYRHNGLCLFHFVHLRFTPDPRSNLVGAVEINVYNNAEYWKLRACTTGDQRSLSPEPKYWRLPPKSANPYIVRRGPPWTSMTDLHLEQLDQTLEAMKEKPTRQLMAISSWLTDFLYMAHEDYAYQQEQQDRSPMHESIDSVPLLFQLQENGEAELRHWLDATDAVRGRAQEVCQSSAEQFRMMQEPKDADHLRSLKRRSGWEFLPDVS